MKSCFYTLTFFTLQISFSFSQIEREIVLINIDSAEHVGIAKIIRTIDSMNPAVLALDIEFDNHQGFSKDFYLSNEIWSAKNLVMCSRISDYTGEDKNYEFGAGTLSIFLPPNTKTGFANVLLENDKHETLKRFSIREMVEGKTEYHFSIQIAMQFDKLSTEVFIHQNPKILEIDFKNGKRKFKSFKLRQIIRKSIKESDVKGKIVIVGYLGPTDHDKFVTPLAKNRNKPDMYGMEILANIICQVLEIRDSK